MMLCSLTVEILAATRQGTGAAVSCMIRNRNAEAVAIPLYACDENMRRNTLVGPSYKNVDLSLIKETRLPERLKVQGRLERINVFNTTNLALPQRRLNESLFGRSTKTQDVAKGVPGIGGGGPGVIQVAISSFTDGRRRALCSSDSAGGRSAIATRDAGPRRRPV